MWTSFKITHSVLVDSMKKTIFMENGRAALLFNFDNWKPTETEWENALHLVSNEEQARICR
jgi:hypothetical protein